MVEKLFPGPFLKNQSWAYLWINILISYILSFSCLPSWELSKVIETKLLTICFYLIYNFLKKQKELWNRFFIVMNKLIYKDLFKIPITTFDNLSLQRLITSTVFLRTRRFCTDLYYFFIKMDKLKILRDLFRFYTHIYMAKMTLSSLLTYISFFYITFANFWYITCFLPNLILFLASVPMAIITNGQNISFETLLQNNECNKIVTDEGPPIMKN